LPTKYIADFSVSRLIKFYSNSTRTKKSRKNC